MITITSIATIGSTLSDIVVFILTVVSIIGVLLKIISIKALFDVMKEKRKEKGILIINLKVLVEK
jgi:uncharacterized membrane protein